MSISIYSDCCPCSTRCYRLIDACYAHHYGCFVNLFEKFVNLKKSKVIDKDIISTLRFCFDEEEVVSTAVSSNNLDILKFLLKNGYSLKDNYRAAASRSNEDLKILKYFVEIELDEPDWKINCFDIGLHNGNLNAIRYLHQELKVDLNSDKIINLVQQNYRGFFVTTPPWCVNDDLRKAKCLNYLADNGCEYAKNLWLVVQVRINEKMQDSKFCDDWHTVETKGVGYYIFKNSGCKIVE